MAYVLGLDIAEQEARAVLLRTTLRRNEVQRYVRVPLDASQSGRGAALHASMRELLRRLGRSPDVLIAAMPGQVASIRTLSLPSAAAKRASEILPFELEPLLPFPIEEAVVDHQPIETRNGELRLLVAAVPKDRVRELLETLRVASLQPKQLALGAAALDGLTTLVPELSSDAPLALVELADASVDVCIVRAGHCEMARTLSAGLGEQQEGLASVQATLHRTLTAYRAASGRELSKVYVAGNLASNPELPATLSEALGLEVQSLALPPPPGSSQEPDPAFMRAAALAGRATVHERRINLRQGEFAPPHAASALRNYLRLGSACAVTIALSLAFAIASQRSLLLDEQTRLKERLGRETKAVLGREVSTAKEARKLLKSIGLSDDPLPSFDAFDALEAVSASIDEDVTHDVRKLRIDVGDGKHEGRFELLAALGTIEQRDQVAEKLKAHKCFHEVEKGRTTPAPGRDRINYRLEGTIRCWESRPQDKKRRKRSKRI